MAKDYKKNKKSKPVQPKTPLQFSLTQQYLVCFAVLLVLILAYFAPIVFENKVPPSTDIIAWKGNAQSILQAKKELHTTPLWANNVFSGMPAQLISLRPPFEQPARYIIDGLGKIIKWQPVYFLLGAIGMVLLFRFWNLSILAGAFSALAFIWWPNFMGLLEAGHNSKVQTVMLIPFVLLTFLRLFRKPNLLNFALFSISFGLAVRAGHYQIVFYTGLLLAFFGVVELYNLLKEKLFKTASLAVLFTVIAMGLGVGMSAFNSLLVREYSKYSIRGGTGEKESTGLDMDYATQWSLHPGEMYNFIIPRFYGGHSSQMYKGEDVPQFKGRIIPGYWGHMPFTSTTDYFGIVTLFFAVVALVFLWKEKYVRIFAVFILFALLMAFGRHFPYVYKIFFNYMPFFNKFRIPTMIVIMVLFSSAVLAGMGMQFLLEKAKEMQKDKKLIFIAAFFALLGLIPLLLRNSLPLASARDLQAYEPQVLDLLKLARFDLLQGDAIRMLGLLAAAFGITFAYAKSWLNKPFFYGAIVALLLFDLFGIDSRYMQTLVPQKQMDSYFTETQLDQFLKEDKEPHRIYPLGQLAGQAHWSYHHESIEGYHPAKLRIYQDIRESCLLNGTAEGFQNDARLPLNWNVLNMLNAKYVLAQGQISHPNLMPVYNDEAQKIVVYQNRTALPRAFCVGQTTVIEDRQKRFAMLNNPDFHPAEIAIIEQQLNESIEMPDSSETSITKFEPNAVDVSIKTDKQTFMVLSEIYYPAGWKAFINGQEKTIYKVNHVLRGVVVPAGTNTVEFRLKPDTFVLSRNIMGGSMAVVYLLLAVSLVPALKRKNEIV